MTIFNHDFPSLSFDVSKNIFLKEHIFWQLSFFSKNMGVMSFDLKMQEWAFDPKVQKRILREKYRKKIS